jgi:hypothetical protein
MDDDAVDFESGRDGQYGSDNRSSDSTAGDRGPTMCAAAGGLDAGKTLARTSTGQRGQPVAARSI